MDSRFDRSTDDVLVAVLGKESDVYRELVSAWNESWLAVSPPLLELCRLGVARALGCAAELAARTPVAVAAGFDERKAPLVGEWRRSDIFSSTERAVLAFTEQFVFDVASLDDALAADVARELGDQGLADFTNALLILEQRQRLRLLWEQMFSTEIELMR